MFLRHLVKDSFHGGSDHRKGSTDTAQHNTEKHGNTSTPRAGFEPAIPVLVVSKTICDLDCAAAVIGS